MSSSYRHVSSEHFSSLPQLLVIDGDSGFCKVVQHQAQHYPKLFGVQVHVMRYDATGEQGYTVEQLVDYIKHPDHHIDMVLTGNSYRQAPYGQEITRGLKHDVPVFVGPVGIQMSDIPTDEDKALALAVGATGVFNKQEIPFVLDEQTQNTAFAVLKQQCFSK